MITLAVSEGFGLLASVDERFRLVVLQFGDFAHQSAKVIVGRHTVVKTLSM